MHAITTPIYYVNDKPHLGSAYTTLMCDVWARYYRFLGEDVFFLTGTDEHGQKIEQAALNKQQTPQDFVDQVSVSFKNMVQELKISHTDYIRTTEERHKKSALALWDKLVESGYVYLGIYEGWYSIRDEAYYHENELINGQAPSGADVVWTQEESYFFKLSAFSDALLSYYEHHPDFIMPQNRRNEVISFVKSGLIDLSISRTSFSWGIAIPKTTGSFSTQKDHIMYVWVDALANYLTALDYPHHFKDDLFKSMIHVVGKDILRFHAVYWPAFLMAAGLPLPQKIFAHGWWTVEGEKMSKSLGNTIDPIELSKTYGLDCVKNYLLREMPFGQDGNFSKQNFIQRSNADLSNALGNLVQRVLTFVQKQCGGKVPDPSTDLLTDEDQAFLDHADRAFKDIKNAMNELAFHKAIDAFYGLVYAANAYMDHQKPWSLKETDPARMTTCLFVLLETIRKIAHLMIAFFPDGAFKILTFLGLDPEQCNAKTYAIPLQAGSELLPPTPLYPKFLTE